MLQQCLTCTRRNIPPEQVSCPACGSVDLRGYDPEHDTWSEHPEWSREEWREAVSRGDTQRGYWDWVAYQVETHADEATEAEHEQRED